LNSLSAYNAKSSNRNYETVLGRRGVFKKRMSEALTSFAAKRLIFKHNTFLPCQWIFLFKNIINSTVT